MKRDRCFRVLAEQIPHDVVVSTYTSAFEWIAIRKHPLNYLSVGAMGLASSHALGLALALPERRIIVLDGDGSLLMNLGTLVSIASNAPKNLFHFVCCNGTYEANGAHPTPGRGQTDLAGMARSAGYRRVETFLDLQEFASGLPDLLRAEGPAFIVLNLEPGDALPTADYPYIHSKLVRDEFAGALRAPANARTSPDEEFQ